MKKNGICLLLASVLFVSAIALDNGLIEQEDSISHEELVELAQKKRAIAQKKLWWRIVTGLGTVGLMSFLAYKYFIETPIEPIRIPPLLPVQASNVEEQVSQQEIVQEDSEPGFIAENTIVDEIPKSEVIATKKLTPQEIALYQMRYENLRNYSATGFLSVATGLLIAGPIALPIDLLLLSLSAAFGGGALHYKDKLNPGSFRVSESPLSDRMPMR